jgi:hypothetical protein
LSTFYGGIQICIAEEKINAEGRDKKISGGRSEKLLQGEE